MRGLSYGQTIKNLPASAGNVGSSPVQEDATCSRAIKPRQHNYWARPGSGAPKPQEKHGNEKSMHSNEDLAQPKVNNKNLKMPVHPDSGSKYKEEGMDSGAFTGDVNGMVIGCGRWQEQAFLSFPVGQEVHWFEVASTSIGHFWVLKFTHSREWILAISNHLISSTNLEVL